MSDAARARLERWALPIALGVVALAGILAIADVPPGIFQDDGHYLILARSLAAGAGYSYQNLPGAPGGTHFPPGYPALLALVAAFIEAPRTQLAVMQFVNPLSLVLAAWAIARFAKRAELEATPRALVALIACTTAPILFLTGILFSEIVFIAALYVVLDAMEGQVQRSARAIALCALLGVAGGAVTLVRTLGVALPIAFILHLAARRRWADAAAAAGGAALLLVPWLLWSTMHAPEVAPSIAGAYGSYGTWLTDAWQAGGSGFVLATLRANARDLSIVLVPLGSAFVPGPMTLVLGLLLLAVLEAAVVRVRARMPVALTFAVGYLGLVLLWPFAPDRFLWPLWPLVVLLVASVTNGRRWRDPLAIAVIILSVCWLGWHAWAWPRRAWEAQEREAAPKARLAVEVASSLPPGLIATDYDAVVHLATGRTAIPVQPLTAVERVRPRTPAERMAQLRASMAHYHPAWVVVVDRESYDAADALTRGEAPWLVRERVWPAGAVAFRALR
ncbi:MAG: hypothetical protein K2X99_03080 [Gemmatimonadaceae bacterium]|nr:hypothetical protein [Gemmatimonadaceae bacterium]